MAQEFLNAPIMPGKPATRDEHRRLMTVLVVVLVIAALILVGVLLAQNNVISVPSLTTQVSRSKSAVPPQISAQLQNAQPASASDIQSVVTQLQNQKKKAGPVTSADGAAAAAKLQAQMSEQ